MDTQVDNARRVKTLDHHLFRRKHVELEAVASRRMIPNWSVIVVASTAESRA
jgi:hypothetical protein